MMNYTTDSGIRVIISGNLSGIWPVPYGDTANVYVSMPEAHRDNLWTLADFIKVGPRTTAVRNGRFAASFKDVYMEDVDAAIRHIDYWHGK